MTLSLFTPRCGNLRSVLLRLKIRKMRLPLPEIERVVIFSFSEATGPSLSR